MDVFFCLLGFVVLLVVAELTRPWRYRYESRLHERELAYYERRASEATHPTVRRLCEQQADDCRRRIRVLRVKVKG